MERKGWSEQSNADPENGPHENDPFGPWIVDDENGDPVGMWYYEFTSPTDGYYEGVLWPDAFDPRVPFEAWHNEGTPRETEMLDWADTFSPKFKIGKWVRFRNQPLMRAIVTKSEWSEKFGTHFYEARITEMVLSEEFGIDVGHIIGWADESEDVFLEGA